MKARIGIKRMAFVAFVGVAVIMLTSCMHMALGMIDILQEVDYQLAEYTGTSAGSYSSSSSYSARPAETSYQKAPVNVYMTAAAQQVDRQISQVWQQCEQEGIRDYDGNGVTNCCDKATAFCIKWRRQYSRRVRLCQQMRDLDHMYVQIWLDGYGWWSVDPRWTSNGTHDMKQVWKYLYDRDYDDVDAYWVKVFSSYIY